MPSIGQPLVQMQNQIQILETPMGKLRAIWSPDGLWSLAFFEESVDEALPFRGEDWSSSARSAAETVIQKQMESLEGQLESYFLRGHFEWDLDSLDWRGVSRFQRQALRACYEIPSGTTCTYAELAARIGNPKAARAIGAAMGKNRWPLLIPCHRVVGSNGRLTGYSGIGGIDTKRRLLDWESKLASNATLQA